MRTTGSGTTVSRAARWAEAGWFGYVLAISATGLGLPLLGATVRPEHVGLLVLVAVAVVGRRHRVALSLGPPFWVSLGAWVAALTVSSVFVAWEPARSVYIVLLIVASLGAMAILMSLEIDRARLVEVGTWAVAALAAVTVVAFFTMPIVSPSGPLVALDAGTDDVRRAVGLALEANIAGSFAALWLAVVLVHRAALPLSTLVLCAPIAAMAVLTLTRAAWVSVAITAVVLLFSLLRSRRAIVSGAASVAALGAATAVAAILGGDNAWAVRLRGLVDLGSGTGAFRLETWAMALDDVRESGAWLVGLGANSFQQRHADLVDSKQIDYFSNAWLAQFHDGGLIGIVGIIVALGYAWWRTSRRILVLPFFATLALTAGFTNQLWFAFPWVMLALLSYRSRTEVASTAGVDDAQPDDGPRELARNAREDA